MGWSGTHGLWPHVPDWGRGGGAFNPGTWWSWLAASTCLVHVRFAQRGQCERFGLLLFLPGLGSVFGLCWGPKGSGNGCFFFKEGFSAQIPQKFPGRGQNSVNSVRSARALATAALAQK